MIPRKKNWREVVIVSSIVLLCKNIERNAKLRNQTVLYQSFNKQLPMVCPRDGAVEETQTQNVLVGSTVNSLLVGDRALVLIWLKFFYYGVKKSVWEKNEHVKIYYESVFFFSDYQQARCFPTCSRATHGEFSTHYWKCLVTGCIISSPTTELLCFPIYTHWL